MRNKLASSIAILLNYGAKWRVLYYVFYVLCLNLEISIILDQKMMLLGHESALEDASQRGKTYQANLFDTKNGIQTFIGLIRPDNWLWNISETQIFVILVVWLSLLLSIVFPLTLRSAKPEFLKSNTGKLLCCVFLFQGNFMFLMSMILGMKTISCKQINGKLPSEALEAGKYDQASTGSSD